ncbi:MAG TPA: hypothetical protein VN783_00990 [Thermoanaerobaculia bacterium]|nr:hypothetical protein [Thermoanaerobaculia bacterium]
MFATVKPPFLIASRGLLLVRERFPDAALVAADGPWEARGRTFDWRLVYRLGESGRYAILHVAGFAFEEPELAEGGFEDAEAIPLPLPLGLFAANALAADAGFFGPLASASLRRPKTSAADAETQYLLTIPSQGIRVSVGVDSKRVESQPLR